MNYTRIYQHLIERAKQRTVDGYSERHHIVPHCIGGSDKEDNLVNLTPEEHYVAHQLLVKLNPGHKGLLFAALAMSGNSLGLQRHSNKVYGWLRRRLSQIRSSSTASEETKIKMSASAIYRIARDGHPKHMLGRNHTEEVRAKISATMRERVRQNGNPMQGRKLSAEARAKIAENNRKRIRCPKSK